MSRIKGRYVAQVILTVDAERTEGMVPIEVIKENFAGITITNESGKDWRDLPYLNGTLDTVPMTNAQWVYMRQQQVKWIAPQVMACIMVALHRKYGFGFDRCARIYSQIQEIAASYGDDPQKIHDACLKETGINITEVYTQKRSAS